MSVAQGNSASVDVTVTNAVLSADSLSLGGGEAAKVTMTGNRATWRGRNTEQESQSYLSSADLSYSDPRDKNG